MSTISSSSILSTLLAQQQKQFAALDTDSSGTISKDEFVAGRPDNVSAGQPSALYDKIDVGGTGALTQAQLTQGLTANQPSGSTTTTAAVDSSSTGTSNLSDSLIAQLIQILGQLTTTQATDTSTDTAATDTDDDSTTKTASATSTPTPPTAADLFKKLDTDGDGKISKAEFVAGRPHHMHAAKAEALFDSIDTSDSGSITEDQLAANLQSPPAASDSTSSDSASNSTDANALIQKLLKAIESYSTATNASTTTATVSASV